MLSERMNAPDGYNRYLTREDMSTVAAYARGLLGADSRSFADYGSLDQDILARRLGVLSGNERVGGTRTSEIIDGIDTDQRDARNLRFDVETGGYPTVINNPIDASSTAVSQDTYVVGGGGQFSPEDPSGAFTFTRQLYPVYGGFLFVK